MEAHMTDYQFRALLEMVLKIVDKSESVEEAASSIRDLLKKDSDK